MLCYYFAVWIVVVVVFDDVAVFHIANGCVDVADVAAAAAVVVRTRLMCGAGGVGGDVGDGDMPLTPVVGVVDSADRWLRLAVVLLG